MTIPLKPDVPGCTKKGGFYDTRDITYLDNISLVATQPPFLIGYAPTVSTNQLEEWLTQCFSKSFVKTLNRGLLDGDSFESIFERLVRQTNSNTRLNLANVIARSAITTKLDTDNVVIVHLGHNAKKGHCEPNNTNVQVLVTKFLLALFKYNKKVTLVKFLLLHDIMQTVISMIKQITELTYSMRQHLFNQCLRQQRKFCSELFILSFNGSKYDLPLIVNFMYSFSIKHPCKIETYKRGGTIASVNISSRKSSPFWAQYITFKDVRNLTDQGTSLELLGKRFGVPEKFGKGTFPHSANCSVRCVFIIFNYLVYDIFTILIVAG